MEIRTDKLRNVISRKKWLQFYMLLTSLMVSLLYTNI